MKAAPRSNICPQAHSAPRTITDLVRDIMAALPDGEECLSHGFPNFRIRGREGLYAKARAGTIKEFTGISDPYDVPTDAEVVIDTTKLSAEEAANEIYLRLEK